MPGVVARPNLSLVIPYRRGKAKTTDEPLHTLATNDSAALLAAASIDIDDCRFRMLKPREHGRAPALPGQLPPPAVDRRRLRRDQHLRHRR
jgi:DNA (cytosine-5)-methyltransferase 1